MTIITLEQLVRILPLSARVAPLFVGSLNLAMTRYGIDSPVRVAAFLAQCGHESGSLTRLVENLNYDAQGLATTWPSRYAVAPAARPLVPNALARRLARQPQAIANNTYAGRNGNGDEASGDGWRYRGRGILQLTGRANYRQAGEVLGYDLEARPDLVSEQPVIAALTAGLYWSTRGCNELADAGDFVAITKKINGGTKGLNERIALRNRAAEVLLLA